MNPMQKLLNDKTVALSQLSRLSALLSMRGLRLDDGTLSICEGEDMYTDIRAVLEDHTQRYRDTLKTIDEKIEIINQLIVDMK
jgi:hypothetical protein